MDIESFWEYSDPAASEGRFQAALNTATGDEQLELLTQIARTYSLRKLFDEAQRLLNQVQAQLSGAGPRPCIRYELERGRTFNSNGDIEQARQHFLNAWQLARSAAQDGLAVDAAHMLAITHSGTPQAHQWAQAGLELARPSTDPKARALIPALLNNAAWDLFDAGSYEAALAFFEEALIEWTGTGKIPQIQMAKWSVGRCLRALGRYEQALSIQFELESAHRLAGTEDGFVLEEIAEDLTALGREHEAGPYFGKAYALLSQDAWLVNNEPERLASLQTRASSA
jgi:tetratricopeptide (TPR) repeat protein